MYCRLNISSYASKTICDGKWIASAPWIGLGAPNGQLNIIKFFVPKNLNIFRYLIDYMFFRLSFNSAYFWNDLCQQIIYILGSPIGFRCSQLSARHHLLLKTFVLVNELIISSTDWFWMPLIVVNPVHFQTHQHRSRLTLGCPGLPAQHACF